MATMTLIEAINTTLHEEMARDDRVVVLGEDVGKNGGVFRATVGLYDKFGADRVMDTPLAESGIIGAAIGMALYGLRPVPEIQFLDFIYPGFDQIVSEMAKFRYRSGGQYPCPVVIRTPSGGGIRGGHYHSQSSEAYFCHTPGLVVAMPSTPADARGMLRSAIRGEDPVLFLEPKRLYRSAKGEVPDGDWTVPFGKARLVREGTDLSLIAWGAMVPICEEAATAAGEKGWSLEVLDLRSLLPFDAEAIVASVRKTGRAVVVHEAPRTAGFGAEVVAILAERALDALEAPVLRVAGLDTPFPYTLEHVYLPDARRVLRAVEKTMAW
ncbi:MAG: alpha-ketoacid dehydrogenase subunit beta [Planctomycetales bacterium]|nr:alpha-ketoacid dehydrogenase subunit beta [Planctomycetales bacterium]